MITPASAPAQPPPPVFVLFYSSADNIAAKAPPVFPAHKVRLDEFHARGEPQGVVKSWEIRQWNETLGGPR